MTRLTAHIRDGIINKAVETSGITDRNKALIESRALFAERVRQACLKQAGTTDDAIRKVRKEVKNRQISPFIYCSVSCDVSRDFSVNVSGSAIRLWLDGAFAYSEKTHLTAAYTKGQENPQTAIFLPYNRPDLADSELLEEFMELEHLQESLNRERATLKTSVRAAVTKFTTVEKLLENWPEAKELLPAAQQKNVGTGLALDKDSLNGLCGIPQPK